MPVCAVIAERSVLIQLCDLRLITTENVYVECAAFALVNARSGKDCLRLDLLDCEDILLCCSGGTDLGFFGLSGCTWLAVASEMLNDSCRDFSNDVWLNVCFEKSSNTGLSNRVIRNLLLVCVIEFGCSKSVFKELANFILSEGAVEIPYFVGWFSLVIYGEIKRSIWF